MAVLSSLTQANASVGDTFDIYTIVELLDAPNGKYRWAATGGPPKVQTLTDAANISLDLNLGKTARVTLASNRVLDAPLNFPAGETLILHVIQDAVGNRTLTWNAAYKFSGGIAPVLTGTAAARDVFYISSHNGTDFTVSYLLDAK